MDQIETTISGTIEKFIYQNSENGFAVFTIKSYNQDITVTGYLPSLQAGQEVKLNGIWGFHKKFGKQFQAKSCLTNLPETISGLKKYLGSGLIKGIGKVYAENLVNKFGTDILKIIDQAPERLKEVDGIGQKRLDIITKAWQDQKEIANIMVFLQDKGISTNFASKIYKQYKNESIAVLTENPYRLAGEIWGIGFKSADEIAQKIGFPLNSPKRIQAGICFAITQATQNGHLYIELNELKEKTIELLNLNNLINSQDIKLLLKKSLIELYDKNTIKLITYKDTHYITLAQYYFCENNVSNKIKNLLNYKSLLNFDIDNIYNSFRQEQSGTINLNEDQQRGIITSLQSKITVITGGPGTGKTTLIKKLLSILDQHKVSYKLAAPTGRAAKRITEGTGKLAFTVHRLLEFDPTTMAFVHNERNALKLDFLIIDESSMIDIFLANSILKALPNYAHILFIGDIDQLPSVGAGNFLSNLIQSEKVPCVRLTQIFRQAQDSLIIVNAHKINKGEFPVSNLPETKKDFIFIKEEVAEKVPDILSNIFGTYLKKYNINISDAIVLTPMNRGVVGTHSINHFMQEFLNPVDNYKEQINHAGTIYRVNDRVMQIKNNYDKHVYNGDMGIIDFIDKEEKILRVNYQEKIVEYDFDELFELVLSYAVSIHKSQGSEYNAVIIPIFMQHFMLLQRNLIYTGITRAKKLCIFIGQPKAVAIGIRNNQGKKRVTFLKEFLTDELKTESA